MFELINNYLIKLDMNDVKKSAARWGTATGVASLMGLSYLHGFVYPRTEAEALINRVNRQDNRISRQDDRINRVEDKLLNQLSSIQDKLDKTLEEIRKR